MSRKEIISIVILVLVAGYGAWQYFHSSFTQTKSQHLMDTVVRVTATSKSKNIGTRIDSVFSYIKRLEDKLNDYSEDSWLWKINHSDQTQFAMDPDIYELLVISDSLYKITDGTFDPTIKRFTISGALVPGPTAIPIPLQTPYRTAWCWPRHLNRWVLTRSDSMPGLFINLWK
jgi:thiamine biosynthesis lipoprotein ApbE